MGLACVKIDELLDRALEALARLDPAVREELRAELLRTWLFHDLQLEGVNVDEADIHRALRGEEGNDFCDRQLLDQLRSAHRLLDQLSEATRRGGPELTLPLLQGWRHALSPEEPEPGLRSSEGPTEQYKHPVAPADGLGARLAELLTQLNGSDEEQHPIERAIRGQYELLRLWPFPSWSALVARLASNVVLMREGYLPLIVPVQERHAYYQSLHHEPGRHQELLLRCYEAQLIELERRAGALA